MSAYPLLFSRLRIGPLELRNRVVMTAMTTGFGYESGIPNEDLTAYLRERSGELAMTTVGFGAVAPEGRVESKIPWMWRPEVEDGLAAVTSAIREGGGLACLQLGHGGRQASPQTAGSQPVAPSPVPSPFVHSSAIPRELTIPEIEHIIAAFGDAARTAAQAGFDAIEVHGGHGYLIQQFLSRDANRRRDVYGGSMVAERVRFAVEVVTRVRSSAPELAVLVRINGTDLYAGGEGPSEAAQVGAALASAGADALLVSAGIYGTVPYTIPLLDDPEAIHLPGAARVRAHVDVPVIAVGGFARPAVAEAALRRGDCDAVAVGRALLADPQWLAKARRGRVQEIRPCVATVDACAGMLATGDPISCSVNPEVGRERRATLARTASPGRVVVVGLGPAGMEAACRAAELGHDVVAFERQERLGGAARLAARTPTLVRYARLIAWFERRLRAGGVDVRAGAATDGEAIAELDPDLVVVATGAITDPPLIDGYDELATWPVEDLLGERPSSLDTSDQPLRPLILGDGRIALATVLALAARAAGCALLSRGRPGGDASGMARRAYLTRLDNLGVIRLMGHPVRLCPEGVWWSPGGAEEHLSEADALVLADRRRPERPARMDVVRAEVVRVGDARTPRDLTSAIAEGREAADEFTRARMMPARA
jgi:2,4-dienoyl-CoA reductase-like NADH-dependent reductase (Old Yellow Enzyme family)